MPGTKLKATPTMLYIPEDELKIFKKNKPPKTSMSKFIKNSALQFINFRDIPLENISNDDNEKIIEDLKIKIRQLEREIQILKAPPEPFKDLYKIWSERIYHYITDKKGKWCKESELRGLFDINSEEDYNDYLISRHIFETTFGSPPHIEGEEEEKPDFEYNSRSGWRRVL